MVKRKGSAILPCEERGRAIRGSGNSGPTVLPRGVLWGVRRLWGRRQHPGGTWVSHPEGSERWGKVTGGHCSVRTCQAPHLHHLVQPSLQGRKSNDTPFAIEEISLQKPKQLT